MVSQDNLTKPVLIPTNVPAPKQVVNYTNSSNLSDSSTIEIRACSEFAEYAAPINNFSTRGKLRSVQGFQGEPLIFAIGKGDRLNCLIHESGASQGWTIYDISPSKESTVAFDVLFIPYDDVEKNLKAGVTLVATTQSGDTTSQVHIAFIPAASLKTPKSGKAVASPWNKLSWAPIADPAGGKVVTTVRIGSVKGRKADQSATVIWAGTKEHGLKAATFYAIDLTPNISDPWIPFAPDTSADQVLDIQPASTEAEDGLFVFSEKLERTECTIYTVVPESLERHNSKGTLRGDLGKINAVHSSRNPWNYTDLVFACEHGVGFVNWKTPASKPIPVSGLPKIGFREVVCSEKVNMQITTETSIVMFAVSEDNDLYYIQGARQWKTDGSISFKSSGLPIRSNVSHISCQFNSAINSSELVYTGTGVDEVKHLIRDPETTGWTESNITFSAPKELKKYHAFVTTISLRDTNGRSVGKNFPVHIKSESMHVLANDSSYRLSAATRELHTDEQGQLVLVSQASENVESAASLSLKAPVYSVEISHDGVSHSVDIQAGQRVIEGLQKMDTPEKLANAKSTTGESIFSDDILKTRKEDFEQSASMLKELPLLLSGVSGNPNSNKEIVLERKAEFSDDQKEEGGFLEFIGDAVEWLRNAVKQVVKVVIRVVAKGIKLLLTIGGKILSFIVEHTGQLLSVIGDFLKDKLGLDFGKFFKWLGLIFDPAKTKENQKILEKTIKTALTLPGKMIRSNMGNLDDFFDLIEAGLKPYLGENAKLDNSADPNSLLKNSPLSWIFDNPILKILKRLNPLSILIEAFAEEFEAAGLGDDFQIPQLGKYLTPVASTLWEGFKSVIGKFADFLNSLWSKIKESISNPSEAMNKIKEALRESFWFLFDTIKTLVKTALNAVGEFMDGVVNFLEAKWKFPLITTLFEWYAEQDFTLLNLFTFIMARLFGIIVGDDNVAKYIDPGPNFDSLGTVASRSDTFSTNLKEMKEALSKQSGPVVFTKPSDNKPFGVAKMSTMSAFSISSNSTAFSNKISSDHVTINAKASHELSNEAKARIHQYEKWAKIIATGVGIPRMVSIYLETAHLMAKIGAAESHGDHDGPDMAIPVFTVITTTISLVGSITQMCNWLAARDHSEEVKKHLDHNFGFICAGVSVGILSNLAAVGCSLASYFAVKKGDSELGKNFAGVSGLCLCIGTYGEVTGVHLIPAFRSDENTALDITLGFVELVGNTGGVVALVGGKIEEPETLGVGVAIDGLCTFVSTLTGVVLLTTQPSEDH